ncbi:biopolymer transporter ExbD [Methylomonas sp. AM2-LC]|uniref:ExbD/TolR family protein n=1 Tax=Methylomonas sp. AM2-LC TaxID=3153301 RepID=UPI003267E80C
MIIDGKINQVLPISIFFEGGKICAYLETELKAHQERDPDISIQLQADKVAIFESVAKVMASAQRSGVGKLSFVTVEQ